MADGDVGLYWNRDGEGRHLGLLDSSADVTSAEADLIIATCPDAIVFPPKKEN